MQLISKADFFKATKTFEYIPFTQTEGWVGFCYPYKEESTIYLVDNLSNPQIACLGHIKKMFGLSMLLIEGECIKDLTINKQKFCIFYSQLSTLGYDMIELNSSLIYSADYEICLRRSGFKKPVGLFSIPLSILVKTKEKLQYNRNWVRNIKKAKEENLYFEKIVNITSEITSQIEAAYKELTSLKNFSQTATSKQLNLMLSDENMHLFCVKNKDGKALCFRIIHINKDIATDVWAANIAESRSNNSTYFFIESILKYLAKKNVQYFDFGRILPGGNADSVYLFKQGIKGETIQYNGEWSWYKSPIYRPLMYFVKKYLMRKPEM